MIFLAIEYLYVNYTGSVQTSQACSFQETKFGSKIFEFPELLGSILQFWNVAEEKPFGSPLTAQKKYAHTLHILWIPFTPHCAVKNTNHMLYYLNI